MRQLCVEPSGVVRAAALTGARRKLNICNLILRSALLRASRRMAASPCRASILRDGRPSKSAIADFGAFGCRSRASPTSVGGLLRMRSELFYVP